MDDFGCFGAAKSKGQVSVYFLHLSHGSGLENMEGVLSRPHGLWGWGKRTKGQDPSANPRPFFSLQDIAENGCVSSAEESLPKTLPSTLEEAKDPRLREDRRPITVHFGQVCAVHFQAAGLSFWFCQKLKHEQPWVHTAALLQQSNTMLYVPSSVWLWVGTAWHWSSLAPLLIESLNVPAASPTLRHCIYGAG